MQKAAFRCRDTGKIQYMIFESPNVLIFSSGFPKGEDWYTELKVHEREFYANCEQHYTNFVKRCSLSMEKLTWLT